MCAQNKIIFNLIGGAISSSSWGSVTIISNEFISNSAFVSGGSIVHTQGKLVDRSIITLSTATTGGAITMDGQDIPYPVMYINSSTVSMSTSEEGGGVWMAYGTTHIVNSTIMNNTAIGSMNGLVKGAGGGIKISSVITVHITNTNLASNSARYNGGAIEHGQEVTQL